MSVPDEGYHRKALCAIHSRSILFLKLVFGSWSNTMRTSSSRRNVTCSLHFVSNNTHSFTHYALIFNYASIDYNTYCLCFPNIIIFNQCCSIRNEGYFVWLHFSNSIKTANTIVWPTLRKLQWVSVKNEF
jgi:hypothetical protein